MRVQIGYARAFIAFYSLLEKTKQTTHTVWSSRRNQLFCMPFLIETPLALS